LGRAIGRIAKSFTGATANDVQEVEILQIPLGGPNLYWYLENRVLMGCQVHQHSAAGARSENVSVGWSSTTIGGAAGDQNSIILRNKLCANIASDYTLAIGDCSATGASTFRARYVVARSGGFASRTCSGTKATVSYSTSSVTAGLFVPTTMTVGEIPIALVLNHSTPHSYTNGLIKNICGPNILPRFGSWTV